MTGDLAVVYVKADDLQAAFAGLGSSQDPFDTWFRDVVLEVHGINLTQPLLQPEHRSTPDALSVLAPTDRESGTSSIDRGSGPVN